MKKLIALTLVLVMILSMPVITQAAESDFTKQFIVDVDFGRTTGNNYNASGINAFTSLGNAAVTDLSTVNAGYTGNAANLNDATYGLGWGTFVAGETRIFEADYLVTRLTGGTTNLLNATGVGSSSSRYLLIMGNAGSGWISIGSTNHPLTDADPEAAADSLTKIIQITQGKWFHIRLEMDSVNYQYIITITTEDGQTATRTANIAQADKEAGKHFANGLSFGFNNNNDVYIKNIKFYKYATNYKASAAAFDANGAPAADINSVSYDAGSKIELSFKDATDKTAPFDDIDMKGETVVAGNIIVTDSLGNVVPYTAGAYNGTDKKFTLTFPNGLLPKREYTITLTNLETTKGGKATTADAATNVATVTFKTKKPPFAITGVSDAGSGLYTVSLQNNGQTGYVVAANYTGDDMTSIDIKPVAADATSVNVTANASSKFYLIAGDGALKILDIWGE